MSSLFREFRQDELQEARLKIAHSRRRYEKYGLLKNPFPLGGNFPEGYMQYTCLEELNQDKIRDFLISTFFRQEYNGLLILGEYGSGKSHLLNYIDETINVDEENIFQGLALSFIIQNPSVAPEDILLSMLREVKLGTVQDLIFLPVRQELRGAYGDDAETFVRDFIGLSKTQGFWEKSYQPGWYADLFSIGYREFIARIEDQEIELRSKDLQDFARRAIKKRVVDNEIIADSLVSLLFQDQSKTVRSWQSFLANSLGGKRGRVVGAEFYLEALLRLFQVMGIRHVYLLVDEIEDLRTQRIGRKAATEYLATLRRMIQHNYKMFSFVLASTRDAWKELKLYYSAIEDRFPVEIDLARSPKQIKRIVANYLEEVRVQEQSARSPWYPFSEAAIEEVIELRGSVLRHVLTECRTLIDRGLDKGVEAPLDTDFVTDNISTRSTSVLNE